MSASLVGSEMCIRDSTAPANPAALARATRPGWPGEVLRGCTAPGGASSCLLYTSDAADDM
eukprot:8373805-Alexandrium_andersonii.AAC.1